jgi:hypothetical protein
MIPSLSQETLTQYATDAQTIAEPQGADYSQGVRVGKTIPAKWWNWLFSAATKRIVQARADSQDMLDELKNVVSDAGLTPSGSDNTQLAQAVEAKANIQINEYITDMKKQFMHLWKPLTINIDGYSTEAELQGLTQIEDKVFITRCVYTYEETQVKKVAMSADLLNWHSVPGAGTSCVFLNGAYLKAGYYYRESSIPVAKLVRSLDTYIWEEYSVNELLGTNYYSAFTNMVFKLNHTVYLVGTYQETSSSTYAHLIAKSSDGVNWAQVCTFTDSQLDVSDYSVASPAPLSDTLYLIGDLIYNTSTDTATLLLNNANNLGAPVFSIPGISDKFVSNTNNYSFIVHPDGSYETMPYTINDYVSLMNKEILSFPYGGYDARAQYISLDGVHYISLPSSLYPGSLYNYGYTPFGCHKIEDTWYISCGRFTTYDDTHVTINLYRAQNLTENASDYTLIRSFELTILPPIITEQYMLQVTESNALIIAGQISYDLGATWENCYNTDGNRYCTALLPYSERFIGLEGFTHTNSSPWQIEPCAKAVTGIGPNYVLGHTLYLK